MSIDYDEAVHPSQRAEVQYEVVDIHCFRVLGTH